MPYSNIKVSVYCAAYNHEKYIGKALEGFVSQNTSFPFEVIVHDDASTDGTAKIIAEYAERYPEIIKPIYQTENQYSKKVKIFYEFFMRAMSGEYIAFCEGDDYWCDPTKLQAQVDILDSHPECVMITHNTHCITVDGEYVKDMVSGVDTGYLSEEDVICKGKRNPHYSSMMVRAEFAKEQRPDFFSLVTGDNAWRTYAITKGKIYYIDKVMSCYRLGTPGSWNDRMQKDSQKYREHTLKTIQFYEEYNKYTNYKFDKSIMQETSKRKYLLYMLDNDFKLAYEVSSSFNLSKSHRLKLWLLAHSKIAQKIYKRRKAKNERKNRE